MNAAIDAVAGDAWCCHGRITLSKCHDRSSACLTPNIADHVSQASDSVRSQCLFTTLARVPAHFPEVNFKPGGFLKIAISSASRVGVA